MSATTVRPGADLPATGPTRPQPGLPAQFGRSLAAEWTKLVSVRSTVYSLLATVAVCVGFGMLFSWGRASRWDHASRLERLNFQPATTSISGVFLAQLVIGSLGVLAMSAEYATGTIRASLSATPQRLVMYLAKIGVFAVVAFVVSLVSTAAAFLLGQAMLSGKHLDTTLSAPGVLQNVVGAALFLVAVSLLGLGLAALLRHTAGAISTVFGLMLVLTILSNFLPSDWQANVDKYLPLNAGSVIWQQHPEPHLLGPWTGLGLLFGYALIALVAGAVVLTRRDA
jgi:ABC-type transport system involved in multi-copper enzyme maturation permease subunit